MAPEVPESPSFYLTNGADRPPIVHDVYVPSTGTWQYVVACPSTLHCVVIDPVRDRCADRATISTNAANVLIAIIKKHGYLCDLILESNAHKTTQTASWYLRMQLSDNQGWPPQICSDATAVATVETMWQRKYGTSSPFAAKLRDSPSDGERIMVGRMRVVCMSIPSFGAPNHRAYLIGGMLFGAHDIAVLCKRSWSATGSADTTGLYPVDLQACANVWTAMQRILSLPEDTCVYYDKGDIGDADVDPFDRVRDCRTINEYVGLSGSEFHTRRQGEFRLWQQEQPKIAGRTRKGEKML